MTTPRTFQMLSVAEAEHIIAAHMPQYAVEPCTLTGAHGRVLREDIRAERDQPPFHRVTMDGIAFAHAAYERGARTFPIEGIQRAGSPAMRLENPAACIEVMTGAMLPAGCDTVVKVEDLHVENGTATLRDAAEVAPWQSVHKKASDHPKGTVIVKAGQRLRGPEIAVAASCGMHAIAVSSTPSVVVISTGDELVDVDEPLLPHQIRRSNSYGIRAALDARGIRRVSLAHIVDDQDVLRRDLAELLDTTDVLMLAGGVSMGKFDFVPDILAELGVECRFHGIRQRPGKPMWFGIRGNTVVFALPGNPVSALVCMHRYALPAIERAMGLAEPPVELVVLSEEFRFKPRLTMFLPVQISSNERGQCIATPNPTNGSGDYGALAGTDGFVELDESREWFPAGHVARLWRWA